MRPLPAVGSPRVLRPPPVRTEVLANGLTLSVVERRELPMVNVEVIVRMGAEQDAPTLAGRTSMLAEMLDEGTRTRGALEIAEQVEHLGACFNVHGGWDHTRASLQVLSGRLDAGLDILADVVLNATLPVDEFARKQRERLTALAQERDEPALLAAKALSAGIFGPDHPFGAPLDGTCKSVHALTRDGLAQLYADRFEPRNTNVLVVGDVEFSAIHASIESRFGGWRGRGVAEAGTQLPDHSARRRVLLVDKPGAAQAELRIGHQAPARDTADYFALTVLNTVLGGSFTSRLNTILRERMAVTYGASSRFRLRRAGGIFTAGAAVLTEAAARSAQVLIAEIERLQTEPVGSAELERAQNYIALGLPRSFETVEDIAAHIREQIIYDLPADYWRTYVDNVLSVTAHDLRSAAARHLHPDTCTIVVVADKKDVHDALERSGLGDVVLTDVAT